VVECAQIQIVVVQIVLRRVRDRRNVCVDVVVEVVHVFVFEKAARLIRRQKNVLETICQRNEIIEKNVERLFRV